MAGDLTPGRVGGGIGMRLAAGTCALALLAVLAVLGTGRSSAHGPRASNADSVAAAREQSRPAAPARAADRAAPAPAGPAVTTLTNAKGTVVAAVATAPQPFDAFTLTDHDGNPFAPARLRDAWTFIAFGYTSCPDVCPLTLAELNSVRTALAKAVDRPIQYVFVSVDPGRDSPARLREYVRRFNPALMGATGSHEELGKVTLAAGVIYRRRGTGHGKTSAVDHTSSILLVDPAARAHAVFPTPHRGADIASAFRVIEGRWRASSAEASVRALPDGPFDSAPPAALPAAPGGAYGFSRYVFSRLDGKVVTTLCEGPRGEQTRCQREDLPCSYRKLKALHTSRAAIPPELRMSRAELGDLVGQLDTLSTHLKRYRSLDQACADGYRVRSPQVVNMGFHMVNSAYLTDGLFDLRKPEILLFAKPGGEKVPQKQLGDCANGKWTGDRGFQVVGAAFMLPTQQFGEDHPAGFAGLIDNWHVHYHGCLGMHSAAALSKETCESRGGVAFDKAGWMIHAWVVPEFDNPGGIFSMWNTAVWPKTSLAKLVIPGASMAGKDSVIFDFKFESVEIAAGDSVTFLNADPFFHTVTAGSYSAPSSTFDSGDLYADQSYNVRFERPGQYEFFCRHHPFMTGTVVVK